MASLRTKCCVELVTTLTRSTKTETRRYTAPREGNVPTSIVQFLVDHGTNMNAKNTTPFGSLWRVWARMTAYWDKLG